MTRKVGFALPSMQRFRGRLVDQRSIREQLVSVAGLVGRPVELAGGVEVGRVVDVIARPQDSRVPHVSGLVVRIGRRKAFVPAEHIATMTGRTVTLSTSHFDVREFERRDGELLLMGDVVDHQLVDIDGVQIVRASDLYIAPVGNSIRLVGVETGLVTLLRRLGPRRFRSRATPERVIDWTDIQMVGGLGNVRIERANRELRRLRPGDLADLLEQLGQSQRRGLVDSLDIDVAADALEEMETDQRDRLLREISPERASAIIAEMEPDEAAEAMRQLDEDAQRAIMAVMEPESREAIRKLLEYEDESAGGIMTSTIVAVTGDTTVDEVLDMLRSMDSHRDDLDAILVVDDEGHLLDDVSLFELAVADRSRPVGELVGPPWPITVAADATIDEVVDAVLSNRRSSVVVISEDGLPLGRILLDDVLDALTPTRSWLRANVGDR